MRSGQTSHGSQSVATPIWNSREIYRASLSTKELRAAHQERRTTFMRVPLHYFSKACQTWFRWNLFVGFFKVTGELRQRRLRETFLDHAALSGPRVLVLFCFFEELPLRAVRVPCILVSHLVSWLRNHNVKHKTQCTLMCVHLCLCVCVRVCACLCVSLCLSLSFSRCLSRSRPVSACLYLRFCLGLDLRVSPWFVSVSLSVLPVHRVRRAFFRVLCIV